jgi:hypothetical protein
MSDLDTIFDSVAADGGDQTEDYVVPRNANVYMGDDETATDDSGAIEDEDFDLDDESVSDETDDETDVDETLDIEDDATIDEFDFETVKDKPVKVTVNGETFEVPLAELRNGYMRQSDYTRKTQQIAADGEVVRWAKVLQDGFKTDPRGVIQYLAEQYGVPMTNEPDPWQELVETDPSLTPLVDRVRQQEQELAELRRIAQTTEQDRETAAVRAELNEVQAKYPDFDPQQVIPVALQNGVRLEQAYKLWKADQLLVAQADDQSAKAKAAEAAQRREKARAAKAKVSQGASKSKATPGDAALRFDSFEDILNHELNSKS